MCFIFREKLRVVDCVCYAVGRKSADRFDPRGRLVVDEAIGVSNQKRLRPG